MAFLSTTALVQRCIVRLRQVPGVSTQSYAEQNIALLLEECYEQCRALRWWDHLTTWQSKVLTGTDGTVTEGFVGARERMRDVQAVSIAGLADALPTVDGRFNPTRWSGTSPRQVEALSIGDDPDGTKLFRVWPLASTGDVVVRLRADPGNVFTDAGIVVPFDAGALVNGACMKYAIMDGTNPGAVQEFDRAYNERVKQLLMQHDTTIIQLDTRQGVLNEWREEPF